MVSTVNLHPYSAVAAKMKSFFFEGTQIMVRRCRLTPPSG